MEKDFSLFNNTFSISKQKIFSKGRFIIPVCLNQICLKHLTFLHANHEVQDSGFCMQKREDISVSLVWTLFTPVLLTPPLSFPYRPVAGDQTRQSPLLRLVQLDLTSTKAEVILQGLRSFLPLLSPARKEEFRAWTRARTHNAALSYSWEKAIPHHLFIRLFTVFS